jgi:lipoprotein-anchoring transpeptidase ErfK/SrfK
MSIRNKIVCTAASFGVATAMLLSTPSAKAEFNSNDGYAAMLNSAAMLHSNDGGRDDTLTRSAIPREIVRFKGDHLPGTIIVNTVERRLYLVLEDGKAMRYGVGVGRPGFEWNGNQTITMKQEWPDWRPPAAMLKRRPDLPRFMKGGEENPLGARAMYLGSSIYRIHGSNEPNSIGQAVSSGCIRMHNEDVVDLYSRVKVGTRVVVL